MASDDSANEYNSTTKPTADTTQQQSTLVSAGRRLNMFLKHDWAVCILAFYEVQISGVGGKGSGERQGK